MAIPNEEKNHDSRHFVVARCMPDQGTAYPTPHQRHPQAGIGAWQTLLRMPTVESERLPKEAAGPGLTSTLLPRNLEEETARRNSENILRISRARPGR